MKIVDTGGENISIDPIGFYSVFSPMMDRLREIRHVVKRITKTPLNALNAFRGHELGALGRFWGSIASALA